MLVYAVRHAESLANANVSKEPNGELSPLGRQQVERLRNRFRNIPLAAVYSSPFERCIQTAVPIARDASRPIELRPELCEFHNLPADAILDLTLPTAEEIARRNPDVKILAADQPPRWPPWNEPFAELLTRAMRFARALKEKWGDQDGAVLVVSHGSPIARLIDAWLTDTPGPSFRFVIDNAAIAALRHHAGINSLVCLNDVSHLVGLEPPRGANQLPDGSIRTTPHLGYW